MNWLVSVAAKWRHSSFIQVVKGTLESIFPFVFIGSIARVIQISFFSKDGYFNELFSISKWLPHFRAYTYSFQSLYMMTIGIVAILAAYQAARIRARQRQADHPMAGLTAIVSFLLLSAQYVKAPFFHVNFNVFGYDRLLVGLIVGIVVGNIFVWCGRQIGEGARDGFSDKFFSSFKPILLSILLAFLLNKLWIWIVYLVPGNVVHDAIDKLSQSNGIFETFGYSLLTMFFGWCGLNLEVGRIEPNTENLKYVFQHSAHQTVPSPFDGYTLYNGYALLMGLGLTIAILIASHRGDHQKVAKLNLLPALFNSNQALMTGIPLLLNPLYLIPVLIVPIINMFIAAFAISIHIIPSSVYPIPTGTLGLFVPFMATDCNWITIIVGIVIVFIDVLLFIPFVRLSEKVDQRAQILKEESQHE